MKRNLEITLMEIFNLLVKKCPSSIYFFKLEISLFFSFFLYSIIYIIEYYFVCAKSTISISFSIITIISTILIILLFTFHLILDIIKKEKRILNPYLYLRKLDIQYYSKILEQNKLNDINILERFINNSINEIPYYHLDLISFIIAIITSIFSFYIENNPVLGLIILIILFNFSNLILAFIAKINGKMTRQKAADIKYMKGILLEIEFLNSSSIN